MSLVVVVGQGYVGLPIAMRAVEVGHRVVGFDIDVSTKLAKSAKTTAKIKAAKIIVALDRFRFGK